MFILWNNIESKSLNKTYLNRAFLVTLTQNHRIIHLFIYLNILMMLNKVLIQWFWVDVTTKAPLIRGSMYIIVHSKSYRAFTVTYYEPINLYPFSANAFFYFYSTILSSIFSSTIFSSFAMWGATVLVEWFSPGHKFLIYVQSKL